MRPAHILFSCLAGALLLGSGCTEDFGPEAPGNNSGTNNDPVQIVPSVGSSEIYIGTNYTFKNDPNAPVDYVVSGMIVILDSITTIEPGTVIHFANPDCGIRTAYTGALYAAGTAEAPILLRGVDDYRGSWRGIFFGTERYENVLKYCTIRNAGGKKDVNMNEAAAVAINSDDEANKQKMLHVENCTIENNNGFGFFCGSLNAKINGFLGNTLGGNTLSSVGLPFKYAHVLDVSNNFQPVENPNQYAWIYFYNDGFNQNTDLESPLTLKNLGIPYRFNGSEGITIIGSGLTIEPGVSVEFGIHGGFLVQDNGFLQAEGTLAQPIVFKGINGNPGSWTGIAFQNDAPSNILRYCHVVGGGNKKAPWCDGQANITLGDWFGGNGRATVENCHIASSGAYGIAKKSGSSLSQNGNTFTLNVSQPDIYTYQ